ncbi:transmembrane protein 25 isoform X4 [Alligator mississippiensis]|uniref:transmembrane protein 25 isoform X4 n=1 Tax=Alligator mississippiensis TaxID=8496 RepID=UPI00287792E0|nr:transmembrane protein 25 isoform X4 [Alligator mississippiensis]
MEAAGSGSGVGGGPGLGLGLPRARRAAPAPPCSAPPPSPAANLSWARNASAAAPPPGAGLLDARVELPLVAVVAAGGLALGAVLCLSCVVGALCRRAGRPPGPAAPGTWPPSDCAELKARRLPRDCASLPSDLQLRDLAPSPPHRGASLGRPALPRPCQAPRSPRSSPPRPPTASQGQAQDSTPLEPEGNLVLTSLGLIRLPMAGHLYKVSSMSSDEIWL